MNRSVRSTVSLGLAVVVGALLLFAAPAFAEFEGIKTSTGTGEMYETILEAGGGTVTCQAYEESTSAAKWAIKNGKTEAEKGSNLLINIEKWGKCEAKSKELKGVPATLSECGLELVQTGTQNKVPVNIVKKCTVKAGTCEIGIAAGNELTKAFMADAEVENKNLLVEPEISNVVTTTSGVCAGVTGSKEGKLSGVAELKLVHLVLPVFEITVTRQRYDANNRIGTLTIKNRTNAQQTVNRILELEDPLGEWLKPTLAERNACLGNYVATTGACVLNIELAVGGAGSLREIVTAAGGTIVGHEMTGV
jgi:hypothetical protein